MATTLSSYIRDFPYVFGDPNSPGNASDPQIQTLLQGPGTPGAQFDPNAPTYTPSYATPQAPPNMPPDPNAATVTPSQASGAPASRSSFTSDYGSPFDPGGPLSFEVALPMAGAILGASNIGTGLAAAGQIAGQSLANQRKRIAINQMLASPAFQSLRPDQKRYLQANPDAATQLINYNLMPRPPLTLNPGQTIVPFNPNTGTYDIAQAIDPNVRGGGSPYDQKNAQVAYDEQFGTGANMVTNAPDFNDWYQKAWPIYGTPEYTQRYGSGATPPPSSVPTATAPAVPTVPPLQQPPPRTVADLQRALTPQGTGASAAPPATAPTGPASRTPAGGLAPRGQTDQEIQRQERASNYIKSSYEDLPSYKALITAAPALARVEAAVKNPKDPSKLNSVERQELMDAEVTLAKGGAGAGGVTEGQVNLLQEGGSAWDKLNVLINQVGPGGKISDDQVRQIYDIAHEIYGNYLDQYQTIYSAVQKKYDDAGVPDYARTLPSPDLFIRKANVAGGPAVAGGGGALKSGTYNWKGPGQFTPQL